MKKPHGRNSVRILFLFLILSIQFQSGIFSQSRWQFIDSPSLSDLRAFISFGKRKFLVADNIYEMKEGKFVPFAVPPPVKISSFYMLSPEKIWIANVTESSESQLYYFNGKSWKQIFNPLANNVICMRFFGEKNGYIAGLGEIVEIKNGNYNFLKCPVFTSINQIMNVPGRGIIVRSLDGQVFRLDDGKWTRELDGQRVYNLAEDNKGRLFALAENRVFILSGDKWEIHSESPLLKSLVRLFVSEEGKFWACGMNGRILRYEEGWQKTDSVTSEIIYDIFTDHSGVHLAAGANGTLLKYSPLKLETPSPKLTFNRMHLFNGSKTVDDEYGVCVNDFNGDGRMDVFTVGIFEPDRLYINYEDRYRDESQDRNIASSSRREDKTNTLLNLGVASGDIDNDGDLDIFITSLNGFNKLFVNNGNGYFRDFSVESGTQGFDYERTNSAVFADFDNDGDLDLFVTNENATDRIFLNNGAGYFEDATAECGIKSTGGGTGVATGDIDGDNDIDIYVCNWSDRNLLFRNDLKEGKLKFTEVAVKAGIGGSFYSKSNGALFSDFDNDGDLDLYVTNRKQTNRLYLNNGKGFFTDVTETNIGIDSMKSYGVVSGDFDHDGYTDLYVSNIGRNVFYRGSANGKFIADPEISESGSNGYSTGSSAADVDNDGDLDIYIANYIGDSGHLLKNNMNDGNFIVLSFDCSVGNKFGLGAKVRLYRVYEKGQRILAAYRENNLFEGYASQGPPIINFAAEKNVQYAIEVYFPASRINRYYGNVKAGTFLAVNEETGFGEVLSSAGRLWNLILADKRFHLEFYKSAVVLILFLFWLKITGESRKSGGYAGYFAALILLNYILLDYFLYSDSFVFAHLSPLVTTAVLLGGLYYYLEKIKVLQERRLIRMKIARDLHDDLASNLSAVSLYTGSLKLSGSAGSDGRNELISKLERLITEAQESLTEIVWSVTPQNDTMDSLVEKIRNYSLNLLTQAGIRHKLEITGSSGGVIISHEFRRNIFMIIKESLSNVVKYSSAENVNISIHMNEQEFNLSLSDDGCGLNGGTCSLSSDDLLKRRISPSGKGNGLRNIASRAKEINAGLNIISEAGKGVKIDLACKMMHLHH